MVSGTPSCQEQGHHYSAEPVMAPDEDAVVWRCDACGAVMPEYPEPPTGGAP